MQSKLIHKNSGQTMIEVIVALTLIVLFLSGVVILQLSSIKNVNYSQSKTIATKLARQQLERARVIRDSSGFDGLSLCLSTCYINSNLTPMPISPTGTYGQSLVLTASSSSDCPLNITVTPVPLSYRATANVNWGRNNPGITPAQVSLSSCITDWR